MWMRSSKKSAPLLALWREMIAVLRTRKKLALTLFALLVLSGLALLAARRPWYEASLQILVSNEATGANRATARTQETIQAEIALLTSEELLTAVAQSLSLTNQTGNSAQQLATQLSVRPAANAPVITVTYRATSTSQAEQVLNALYEKYAARHIPPSSQNDASQELRTRSAEFNKKLDESNNSIKQLESKQGMIAVAAQKDLLLKQMFEARQQADATRTEKGALEKQIAALRAQVAEQPEQIETASIIKHAPALDKMKEEVIALEMQRTQMLQKYQPQHRLVRDLEQRIAQAKNLITQEEQNPPRERTFALNETRQRLANDLLQAESNFAALSQRTKQLSELLTEYETRLQELNSRSFRKSDLERERAMNEEAYLFYEKKAQEADINAVLSQTNTPRVSLIEAPHANTRPINIRWARDLFTLACVSLLAALGIVFALEILQPRIRSAEAFQHRFGLPVLAQLSPTQEAKLEI